MGICIIAATPLEYPRHTPLTERDRRRSMKGYGTWVLAMRCMACGEEMRVVRVVPDDTMPVAGYEHHTLECPACHEVESRLAFTREIEPVPVELEPSPVEPEMPPEPVQDELKNEPVAVQKPEAAGGSWTRAIDRLRNQQSFLQERQAEAKAAEAVSRFHEEWENLVRIRRQSTARAAAAAAGGLPPLAKLARQPEPAQDSPRESAKQRSIPEAEPRPNAPRTSAMARVIARLHGRELWRRAAERSEEGRGFDQMWESFGPAPRPAAPMRKPRCDRGAIAEPRPGRCPGRGGLEHLGARDDTAARVALRRH
jgi:hypothetical protein